MSFYIKYRKKVAIHSSWIRSTLFPFNYNKKEADEIIFTRNSRDETQLEYKAFEEGEDS